MTKVCAIVVTYNRPQLLIECLNALLKQSLKPNGIVIIDNSETSDTSKLLEEKGYLKNKIKSGDINLVEGVEVYYIKTNENIGGAGGFNLGMRFAYEKGFSLFWLMDDDAEPEEKALEKLMECYNSQGNYFVYANLKIDENRKILYHHIGKAKPFSLNYQLYDINEELYAEKEKCVVVDFSSFVGLLIPKYIVEKIGFPDKRYFVYYDDVDYCMRINKVAKIILVKDSIIVHKEAMKGVLKEFLGRESYRPESLYKFYLVSRNLTFTLIKHRKLLGFINSLVLVLRLILGVVLYDKDKKKRISHIMKGFIDGLKMYFRRDIDDKAVGNEVL